MSLRQDSTKKNELQVEIKNNKLRFNSPELSTYFDQSRLTSILLKSIERQEKDLQDWAFKVKNEKFGRFYWVSTWSELRQDDLVGLNLYYYLDELITVINSIHRFESIEMNVPVPRHVAHYLTSKHPTTRFVNLEHLSTRINYNLSPLKLFLFFTKKRSSTYKGKQALWFSSPVATDKHRYRDMLDYLKQDNNFLFFHANHNLDVSPGITGESLNFAAFGKFKDLWFALSVGLKVKNEVSKSGTNTLLQAFIQRMQPWHYAGMVLREIWIERAIQELNPKAIFFTTAITYPPARLMSYLAYKYNIPFFIVACRSMFTELRMEERAIQADLGKYNDAHVADAFIVWDEFSRKTLINQGFAKNEIYLHQGVKRQPDYKLILKNKFLLLFTHDSSQNDALISLLEKVVPQGEWAIRLHPIQPLTKNQKTRLENVLTNCTDTSHLKMNDIEFRDVIVISINSTAAVEACSYGAGVIWLPFLNFKAILFDEVMKLLGRKLESSAEFKSQLQLYLQASNRQKLINECKEAYTEHFIGETNLDLFLEKLNSVYEN